MKSYTDLPQSKMLAEFLSLESADTIWDLTIPDLPSIRAIPYEDSDYNNKYLNIKPCWSLAALLSILPKSARLEKGKATELYRVSLPVELEASDWYINPVDACYEMIIKLHEQKLL
jgi:hypothetical protein